MPSKKRHEGYLLVDNRHAPVPEELLRAKNIPVEMAKGVFESGVITCSHCQRQVIVNPLRTRERAYCRKCDHYICDLCGAEYGRTGGECKNMKKTLDDLQEQAALAEQRARLGEGEGESLIIIP